MAKAIFISGVIGSGKTTLAEKLSKEYGLNIRKENIKDNTITPKIHHLYSTFDPQTIFEVQRHFLEDSSDMSETLEEDKVYVFDTFPFVSQMVFLESLRTLKMLKEKHFLILKHKLEKKVNHVSFTEHLHIHCVTPRDVFDRIFSRNSFEVHSFDSYGKPNIDLIRLVEQLDLNYYDLVLTNKTVFSQDPSLTYKIKSFLYGE
jgi:deoxyadenosine/deoxycytidine kinase